MKRGVLITLGVVLLLVGLSLVAAGAGVAAWLGQSGAVVSAPARVSGAGVAIIADDVTADAGSIPVPSALGQLTYSVRSTSGSPVFVGAATAAQVDSYLAGAPYAVVVDLGAGRQATTRKVPGTQQPQPPASQSFWSMQATGAPATFGSVPPGSTLVIMNSDARSGVDVEVTARFTVRNAWTGAWIAIGAGALAVVLALVCFWRARVARRRARERAAYAASPEPLSDTVLPEAAPVAASAGVVVAPLDPASGDAGVVEDVASIVDHDATTVMAPVVDVGPTVLAEELPSSPPVAGLPVDVSDEPPAQGGSPTLAALVAAASPEPHDAQDTAVSDAPVQVADPVFAEIAERFGLLPAAEPASADEPGDPAPSPSSSEESTSGTAGTPSGD